MSALKNLEHSIRRLHQVRTSEQNKRIHADVYRYSHVQRKMISATGFGSSVLTALVDAIEILDKQDREAADEKKRANEQDQEFANACKDSR